jgi:adenylate cyclase
MRDISDPKESARPRRRNSPTSDLLLGVSNRLALSKTLTEALDTLVELTATTIGAERGSIFLNDPTTDELYTRVADGKFSREIRMLNSVGVAGHVFTSGEGTVINDAYSDERFNPEVDSKTGYTTTSILCAPLLTLRGDKIGVSQLLNKKNGEFTQDDLQLLEAMIEQAAIALENHRIVEDVESARQQELEFLNVVSEVSSELKLGPLLQKLIATVTRMLDAERSTLFINDEKTNELFTEIGQGLGATQIRLPNTAGIAGTVFSSCESMNIPHAYADLRFNPSFDRQTGFFTRSILCVPVVNKEGKAIGVTQVLNKKGGPFTDDDEARLKAFTSQIAIGLENAKLFDDVQNMKNYSESMFESMASGVMTVNEDGIILTCNRAGLRIMKAEDTDVLLKTAEDFFSGANAWVLEKMTQVVETHLQDVMMDTEMEFGEEKVSANVTIMPLISTSGKKLGSMLMIEDISGEKRMKSTMSRYMDASLADKLLQADEDLLGGQSRVATVLFSDIRSFTSFTEELGAQATVALLNDYFTLMVECIQERGGMLDKFIGDAIMAVFGTPVAHEDDPDRAVRSAIDMMRALEGFNIERQASAMKAVNIGVGINTDSIVSGNIGSPKRMDYTVIGDGVNLASRLESACKQYGTRVLISEYTYKQLKGTYRLREVDRVIVKGKTQPVDVFEILDYYTEESFPNIIEMLGHFRDGIQSYRGQQWNNAEKAFGQALALTPDDLLSKLYLERCQHLRSSPPAEDWDGVWVMTSK